MNAIMEGQVLWEPTAEQIENANVTRFMRWVNERSGLNLTSQKQLWQWSIDNLEDFWESVWQYCEIKSSKPYEQVLASRNMPGAQWFPGAELNYAEHVFLNRNEEDVAIYFKSEQNGKREVTWRQLRKRTAAVAQALLNLGVQPGDRVAAYMPNLPETVIAFLACASIGAIWSVCSPDFGTASVVDRFRQIEPTVLFAVEGCQFNGKQYDKRGVISELQEKLPTLKHTIVIPFFKYQARFAYEQRVLYWEDLPQQEQDELVFTQVPFDHPLWILYSSGTTGLPKPIVHGHGGILIEHLKTLRIEQNTGPGDVFFWYTTTGWMMWNLLVGGLLAGTTIVLYDGSPAYPTLNVLWELLEELGVTFFGTSAGYLNLCSKFGVQPNKIANLERLSTLGSTASPLSIDGFAWVYENVKEDVWLVSASGGTDVCTGFVSGSPILPVTAGELQCRALGVKVESFDDNGQAVVNQVGELVVTAPMPSMPLYFWNDSGNQRYLESYFTMFPGVWRHGDWLKINDQGRCVIYGRSDSTINRSGVRMGTSDLYRIVETRPEIQESLVIDLEMLGRASYLPFFVVMKPGNTLDEALKEAIKNDVRTKLSPRYVPDEIYEVPQIPKTLNGKKLEVPIRKILLGMPLEKAINPDAMSNPESLKFFIELAKQLNLENQ